MANWTDYFGNNPKTWFMAIEPTDRTCNGLDWSL